MAERGDNNNNDVYVCIQPAILQPFFALMFPCHRQPLGQHTSPSACHKFPSKSCPDLLIYSVHSTLSSVRNQLMAAAQFTDLCRGILLGTISV